MSDESPTNGYGQATGHAFRVAVIVLVFLGIFAAGAASGILVTARFARRHLSRLEQAQKAELQAERQREDAREAADRAQHDKDQQKLEAEIAVLRQQAAQRPAAAQRRAPLPLGPQLMQRLINQVQPTPEQRAKISPMVIQAAEDLRRLRRDEAASAVRIIEQLQDRVATVLTPEQQARFQALIDRSRNAFRRYTLEMMRRQEQQRREEGGPPPPAP
jgi:FtsZ-interacting cell division protein ZipA